MTDAEQRSALAVVRSLGRAGHRVVACSAHPKPLAAVSRYTQQHATVTDPYADPGGFVEDVAGLLKAWGVDVLLPITDATCEAILPRQEALGDVSVPLPDARTFRSISDKAHLARVGRTVGISTPEATVVPDSGAPLPADLRFPLVMKPSRSISFDASGRMVRHGVRYVGELGELEVALADVPEAAFPVLLQQRIDGAGVGVFMLRWDGKILAEFAHRRIREKPPTGGVSVYRESVGLDRELADASAALLERFDWRGVAMIEYKQDRSTGTPYLMEVNGRFWGSLQLAIDAGVDFPRLLVEVAMGHPVAPVREYRTGVRSRWWWGDVDQLLLRIRHRDDPSQPPLGRGRLASILEFARPWRPGDRPEVFRWTDPRPFWRETASWFRPGAV